MPNDAPVDTAPPLAGVTTAVSTAADPIALFTAWMADATRTEPNDPNAMTLATATADGTPSARIVLLKGFDASGFVFYSNGESRKGYELATNARVALVLHWKTWRRQVRVEGVVEPVTTAEADAYFASRARVSRLGAIASEQSRPLPDRATLERRVAEADARYPGDTVPRPPHWSGWRVRFTVIEFWQDMPFRLHDRTVFRRAPASSNWSAEKLYP